ncbi:MAG: alpha-glucan family phosphorylase [Gemmatimonadetes bacterium]|nr:alpha-glucan family phosphorylase [Gemmatimonadota bacterium]
MKPIHTFRVTPRLPAPLEPLRAVAHNLRWTWHHATRELFRRLEPELWEATGRNPVLLLGTIAQDRLDAAAADPEFLAHLEAVVRDLDAYLAGGSTWFSSRTETAGSPLIAYFSPEFGVAECLSIFAGGLGVLAGDHLKSASDLGIPLVGVGLLYQQGYFRQSVNAAAWQEEEPELSDFASLPLRLERLPDGAPVTVTVPHPGRNVAAQIWSARVGRVPLYLLDTNVEGNAPEDRVITHQLYGGDVEMRIRQEIVLGIGGYRALEAVGLEPTVYHLNEGHSAFLALERIRRLMDKHRLSFPEAREAAVAGAVFTTHTPVAAGHDYFPPELMAGYLGHYAASFGLPLRELLALGRLDPANEGEAFCMTVLALRMASHSNAVSRLHGEVSRHMWRGLWPGILDREIPIDHITNGVHYLTWLSPEMQALYDRYLGPGWSADPTNGELWRRAQEIPDAELWRVHEARRGRLIRYVRERLRAQLRRRHASPAELDAAEWLLDPTALTIGFARRFATYKRATLLLRDPERLARILNDPAHPVQVLIAGKAHPRDLEGKELIRRIVSLARQEPFRGRLVFVEDHDMALSRSLVRGADVWLNAPRRPREASGTSGMKAAANGVLNLSTLDGWWAEAWDAALERGTDIGWAIGRGIVYEDPDYQDRVEAEALYEMLEQEVVPAFYSRDAEGLPWRWLARMKNAIALLGPVFNTNRMLREYADRFYLPAERSHLGLVADGCAGARSAAEWRARIEGAWPQVRVESVDAEGADQLAPGDELHVRARVHLDALRPDDVTVQLCVGPVGETGELTAFDAIIMKRIGSGRDGRYIFETRVRPGTRGGRHGLTVRVLPSHAALPSPFLPGKVAWAAATG